MTPETMIKLGINAYRDLHTLFDEMKKASKEHGIDMPITPSEMIEKSSQDQLREYLENINQYAKQHEWGFSREQAIRRMIRVEMEYIFEEADLKQKDKQ